MIGMKKLIAVILIMALAVPAAALADLPDISNLSKEELLKLSYLVQNKLFEKTLPDGVLMPAGDYIVGEDIPAGDYRADTVSDVGGIIQIYPSKAAYEKSSLSYDMEIYLGNMWGTLVFRLVLNNGNYVRLRSNSLKLYPYYGLEDLSIPKE